MSSATLQLLKKADLWVGTALMLLGGLIFRDWSASGTGLLVVAIYLDTRLRSDRSRQATAIVLTYGITAATLVLLMGHNALSIGSSLLLLVVPATLRLVHLSRPHIV
jgi:hypothetical protein